jgi:hypothetical protein
LIHDQVPQTSRFDLDQNPVHSDKENIANGKLMLTAVAQQVPDRKNGPVRTGVGSCCSENHHF